LYDTVESYPNVTFRYVVYPTVQISPFPDNEVPIYFNHTVMVNMMNIGEANGQAAVANGTEHLVERAKQLYREKYQYWFYVL